MTFSWLNSYVYDLKPLAASVTRYWHKRSRGKSKLTGSNGPTVKLIQ